MYMCVNSTRTTQMRRSIRDRDRWTRPMISFFSYLSDGFRSSRRDPNVIALSHCPPTTFKMVDKHPPINSYTRLRSTISVCNYTIAFGNATAKWTNQKQCTIGYTHSCTWFRHTYWECYIMTVTHRYAREIDVLRFSFATLRIHISSLHINSLIQEKETIAWTIDCYRYCSNKLHWKILMWRS